MRQNLRYRLTPASYNRLLLVPDRSLLTAPPRYLEDEALGGVTLLGRAGQEVPDSGRGLGQSTPGWRLQGLEG